MQWWRQISSIFRSPPDTWMRLSSNWSCKAVTAPNRLWSSIRLEGNSISKYLKVDLFSKISPLILLTPSLMALTLLRLISVLQKLLIQIAAKLSLTMKLGLCNALTKILVDLLTSNPFTTCKILEHYNFQVPRLPKQVPTWSFRDRQVQWFEQYDYKAQASENSGKIWLLIVTNKPLL